MIQRFLFFLFILSALTSAAYSKDSKENSCIHKGNVIISGGYGFPSIIRAFLKLKTTRDQLQVMGYGPFILKTEYMLNDRFSIGLNTIYNYTKVSWMQDGYDPVTFQKKKYENGVIGNELSSCVRGNYYFWKRKKITSYGGLGLGYGYVNVKSYSKAPTAPFVLDYDLPSPLRFEGTVGMRYFPVKQVGLFAELGLGKTWILLEHYFIPEALFQLGFTVKL